MVGDDDDAVTRRTEHDGLDRGLGGLDLALRFLERELLDLHVEPGALQMGGEVGSGLRERRLGPLEIELFLLMNALGVRVDGDLETCLLDRVLRLLDLEFLVAVVISLSAIWRARSFVLWTALSFCSARLLANVVLSNSATF